MRKMQGQQLIVSIPFYLELLKVVHFTGESCEEAEYDAVKCIWVELQLVGGGGLQVTTAFDKN